MKIQKTPNQRVKQKELKNNMESQPQNITQDSEKEICMGCNKSVETGVQYGSCYRWYHATNVKEQLRSNSRNCTQRKHTTYVKRTTPQSQ